MSFIDDLSLVTCSSALCQAVILQPLLDVPTHLGSQEIFPTLSPSMWLIDVHTLKLQCFTEIDPDIIQYAILSHTWGSEEVTFQEMRSLEPGAEIQKQGFNKIKLTCKQAELDGYHLAWVDTCCIDKTSSAELSEAINSMFRWYAQAQVCYVFMDDVSEQNAFNYNEPEFAKSRWFSRGWTLQELLAPYVLFFFSKEWKPIGNKLDLVEFLEEITGIDQDVLTGERDLQSVPIARRMSWAADRQTTRTEDIAYCLLGVFNVNTSMIYGESDKAFVRLQEEILRDTDDHTIFAWADPNASGTEERGLLAPHPRCFKNSRDLLPFQTKDRARMKVELTNLGIGIYTKLSKDTWGRRRAMLNCVEFNRTHSFAFIYLNGATENYTKRIHVAELGLGPSYGSDTELFVPQYPRRTNYDKSRAIRFFGVALEIPKSCNVQELWVSSASEVLSYSGNNKQSVTAFDTIELGQWNLISSVLNVTSYMYGYTRPGSITMAIALRSERKYSRDHDYGDIYVIVASQKDGRLGAVLEILMPSSKNKIYTGREVKDTPYPGLTQVIRTTSGRRYALTFSQSSQVPGQAQEIRLQLREIDKDRSMTD